MIQRNRLLKNLDSLGPVVQNKSQRFAVCMMVKQFFNPSKFPLFLANLSTESNKRLQNTCFIQAAALTHRFVMLRMISMISGVWTWTNRVIVFLNDFEDGHLYIQRWPFPHFFYIHASTESKNLTTPKKTNDSLLRNGNFPNLPPQNLSNRFTEIHATKCVLWETAKAKDQVFYVHMQTTRLLKPLISLYRLGGHGPVFSRLGLGYAGWPCETITVLGMAEGGLHIFLRLRGVAIKAAVTSAPPNVRSHNRSSQPCNSSCKTTHIWGCC